MTRWWSELIRDPVPSPRLAPWRIGARSWVGILARSADGAVQRDFGVAASSIAFSAFLSVLPLLSLVTVIYGMVASQEAVDHNITTLVAILPGDAQQLVHKWLTNSLTRHEGGGLALLLSAAITLFGARRAGQSLLYGIHIANDVPQDRGPWARLLVAMVVVFAGATLLLGADIGFRADFD